MKCKKCDVEREYIPGKDKSLAEIKAEEANYNFTYEPARYPSIVPILHDGRRGFLKCPQCGDMWPHHWDMDSGTPIDPTKSLIGERGELLSQVDYGD